MKDQINKWINENRIKHINFLQKLVRLNSTQGNEKEVQENVFRFLESMGLEVDCWDLDGDRLEKHPYFFSNKTSFENSPNVVGVLKGSGNGRSIILNGHVDVVPEGERSQWEDDPFSGTIKDGYMYGRGVTDMKGGNASLMIALDALTSLGIRLKGDIIFQSVIEEESGGAGTLDAILQGYQADAALIPEPTDLKVFPKQQGSKWFRIRVAGRTAHGGTRYHGVSAIDKSFMVTEHIKELESIRNERITDPLYQNIPIPVPINIGSIEGGDWPSSVADSVSFEGRIGVAPDETIEHAQEEMEQWLQDLSEKDEWFKDHPVQIEWFGARWVPGDIDTKHPLMNTLINNYKEILTEDPTIEASPWGTDGGLLEKAGNTPSIIFGPGMTGLAHFPNESIEIEKVFQVAKVISATLIDWCGVESDETINFTKI